MDERQRLGQYLEWWVSESLPTSGLRPATLVSYAEKVRLHINPTLGHVRLARLAPSHVEQLLRVKQAEGCSPGRVARIHAVLRAALSQAERWGLVARNVAKLVKAPQNTRPEVVPLTPAEARKLLEAAADDRLLALYSVGLALGLRLGEALGLHWADVDLDAGTLRVRTALQRVKGPDGWKLTMVEPKSKRSRRTIPLPGSCVEALRAHRLRQMEERLAAGTRWVEQGLVFTTPKGTPIDPRNLLRRFHAVCELAGIGQRRFHDLRHTCASLLLAQNVHPRVVMETLGHSQMGLTMDTYSHVLPVLQRDAADLMDRALQS